MSSLPVDSMEAEEEMEATQLFVGTQQTATQVYVEPTSGDSSGGKKDDSAANASATAEETPSEDDSAPNANDAEPASDVPASGDEPAASAKIEKTGDGEAAESGEGASDEDLQAGPRKRRRVRAVREDSSEDGDSETGGEQAKQAEQVPEEPEEEWKAMVRCMAPKDLFAILGPGALPPAQLHGGFACSAPASNWRCAQLSNSVRQHSTHSSLTPPPQSSRGEATQDPERQPRLGPRRGASLR